MSLLPDHAVAQLVMLAGDRCSYAELILLLEQYDYQEDINQPGYWILVTDDPAHANCSLKIENEGEAITVFGEASDHFTNVNYLMHKAGWTQCSVLSNTPDMEAKIMARLVSVDISNTTHDIPASTLCASSALEPSGIPTQSIARHITLAKEPVAENVIDNLNDAHSHIKHLTILNNSLEERAIELEETNAALLEQKQKLEHQLAAVRPSIVDEMPGDSVCLAASASNDVGALLHAIESYLSSHIDITMSIVSPLLQNLRAIGFEAHLKLAKVPTNESKKVNLPEATFTLRSESEDI